MNATTNRLNGFKVAELREIAKRMGLKGVGSISRLRKAELISYLVDLIDYDHMAAFDMMDADFASRTQVGTEFMYDGMRVTTVEVFPHGVEAVSESGWKLLLTFSDVTFAPNSVPVSVKMECCGISFPDVKATMNHTCAISAVIEIANAGIYALTPTLATAKATFEAYRDNGTDAQVEWSYQIYCDITRAIEEFQRTIAYAQND